AAALADAVARRGGLAERQRGFRAVDRENLARTGGRRLDGKAAGEAVEVEDARLARQPRHEAAIGALVVEPAGLLPGEEIGREADAVLDELDRSRERTLGD